MPISSIEQKAEKEVFNEQQLVVFKVAGEEFGVNINEVKEIIRWEDVTRIPNAAPYIKGVINLRGNIIVVNDLAMKLGLPSKDVDDDTRIIVVEVKDDQTVGMVVDSATEVLRLPGEKIRSAPPMVTSNIDHNYIEGVGVLDEKRLLTLLDLSKVLESEDYHKILSAQQIAQQNLIQKEKQQVKKKDAESPKSKDESNEEQEETAQTTSSPSKEKNGKLKNRTKEERNDS
jgi:purine-binding chemotaxis protein CheW